MKIIYTDDSITIKLINNKLIYNIPTLTQLPSMEHLELIQHNLDIFFNALKQTKKKFLQIFIFNDVKILSLLNFTEQVEKMLSFFRSHWEIMENQLECSHIIVESFIIINSMKMAFKLITPLRPVHFHNNIIDFKNNTDINI